MLNNLFTDMTCVSPERRITCKDALNDQDNWTTNLVPDQISVEFNKHLDTIKPKASNFKYDSDSAYYLTKFVKYHISIRADDNPVLKKMKYF